MAVLCAAVVSAMTAIIAMLIKPVINGIFVNKDLTQLYKLPIEVVLVFTIKDVFFYLQAYLMQYSSNNVIKDVRNDLYGHIMYLPLHEYHKTSTGKLSSNVISDVGVLSTLMSAAVKDFLLQSFTIIGLSVVLFIRDWKLALISLLLFPMAGVFLSKYGKKMRRVSRMTQESIAGLMNILQESFTGSRIVKAFTMEDGERERFARENKEYTRLSLKSARIASLITPFMEWLGGVMIATTMLYGGYNVIKDRMTPGDFFSFMTALVMLYQPVKALANLHNSVQQALGAAERVFEVLDTCTEKPSMEQGKAGPDGISDSIVYKDVSFNYNRSDEEILSGVDITIKKGEVVALVGSSGSGKTTLANLLPRFYEPHKGSILIDGVDIREYGLRNLRQQIAIVTQDTILFNDTIRNNIAYGKKDFREEDVLAAARASHADGFIDKLPEKYDTVVGEKGVMLSGGEKQRVSIARALLKDCPILILDEATSSLDTESERIVQNALDNLMKNRTTLVIAHRLSTVINADRIVVIDGGRVADSGRHTELLVKSPIYKRLYDMQFGRLEGEHAEAV